MAAKIDHCQVVTDKIIAALELGVAPWNRDWQNEGNAFAMPRRVTGEYYKGINTFLLMAESAERGFNSSFWLTFNAAKGMKAQVKKGAKSAKVYFPLWVDKIKGNPDSGKQFVGYSCSSVFNADEIDGLPEKFYAMPAAPIDTGAKESPELDILFKKTGANIVTKGNQPLYRPFTDTIEMPKVSQFNSAASYYSVLAHELIHWTGAKKRLDRLETGKEEYAFEELVAELGSLFLCTEIGIAPNFDNSASYIQSWLKALRNDKRFIFKAGTAAQRASEFALDLMGIDRPNAESELEAA